MALPRQEVCLKTDTPCFAQLLANSAKNKKAVGLAQTDGLISLCFKEHRS